MTKSVYNAILSALLEMAEDIADTEGLDADKLAVVAEMLDCINGIPAKAVADARHYGMLPEE